MDWINKIQKYSLSYCDLNSLQHEIEKDIQIKSLIWVDFTVLKRAPANMLFNETNAISLNFLFYILLFIQK